ncbi:hypothetical protein EV385_6658 [Krasilnikovia cinnamomea]|uniref:Uncharacterized protein n=1 Tax=Krasilnikovia cinnamomea TaxID=349313 RepID=A0A4Q7Z9P4_9ACTN|nr:hypothetical protein [Krasilnikovia cinnamomea]RZU46583.1 hypothetical protein EV385_6658 [Krasilnikovia cinnamomea]
MIINPGTQPVPDAREDLAAAALETFLAAVRERAAELEQAPIRYREARIDGEPVRVSEADQEGRFAWDVPFSDGRRVRLLIPGVELAAMQGLSAAAPCLWVGGEAVWWSDAVGLLAGEGMRLKPDQSAER